MSKRRIEKKRKREEKERRVAKVSKKPVVIKFFAPVIEPTINLLMQVIDKKMSAGESNFIILISSPGGSVYHGLSTYNYLKGIPATITTHNFGSVDSIGVVLYCGGSRRLSVPQARFLLHGVSWKFGKAERSLEEPQLEEKLKKLRIDIQNIAKVVAENTGKSVEQVTQAMLDRSTLNPEEAKEWGLVHEIKSELFEEGSEVFNILAAKPPKPQP